MISESVDTFFTKWIFFPIGRTLNSHTGVNTVWIGYVLVLMSGVGYLTMASVSHSWIILVFWSLVVIFLVYVCPFVYRAAQDVEDLGNILPLWYTRMVNARVTMNLLFLILNVPFIITNLITVDRFGMVQDLCGISWTGGLNIATMLWPRRKTWARAKIEELRESKVLQPILVG